MTFVTFHHLVASPQIIGDPAAAVLDAVRHQPPPIAKTPVHRDRITAAKGLDHHKQHDSFPTACEPAANVTTKP